MATHGEPKEKEKKGEANNYFKPKKIVSSNLLRERIRGGQNECQ
jgi:hypothetical protein